MRFLRQNRAERVSAVRTMRRYGKSKNNEKAPAGLSIMLDAEFITVGVSSYNQLPFDSLLLRMLMMVLRRKGVFLVTGDLFATDCTAIDSGVWDAISGVIP